MVDSGEGAIGEPVPIMAEAALRKNKGRDEGTGYHAVVTAVFGE